VAACCSWLVRRLSLGAARRLADGAAWLVMGLFRARQRLAEANITASFPELSAAEVRRVRQESVRNICRTMVELLKLPSLSPEDVRALTDTSRLTALRTALDQGTGVIVLCAHFGNWEWLGAILAQERVPIHVIARDAPHSLTARLINEARASHGMRVIGREDLRGMLGALRAGEMLGILPDQHALDGGLLVEFLGRPAWTFSGPALIAMRTGARVVPTFCPRLPDGTFRVEVLPEVEMVATGDREADTLTNTRRVTAAIEQIIRMYPGQWLWMHDRWKRSPVGPATE
jgi:KDO2-lipid IV(A) lauroyltransferase